MKHAHIAYIGYPEHPHVGPTLPIVSVLVRRGYRVTYVTSDRFASRVEKLGAEVVPSPEVPLYRPAEMREDKQEGDVDAVVRLATNTLKELTSFYEENTPDLIIYDWGGGLAGRIWATRWRIPAIAATPTFAHDLGIHDQQIEDARFRKWVVEWGEQVDIFLTGLGMPSRDGIFHREKLNIYLCPKAFQPCAALIDERRCFYAGRCAGEQPWYGRWVRKDVGNRKIAFVATSTLYVRGADYFRMCMQALSGNEWHVILSIGEAMHPESLGPLPPNCEIIQHTSHVKILPHASLYICLGGIISSAEAMYHGVPLIVMSYGFPELEWQAENLVNLGVALHLRKHEINTERLKRAVAQISEDIAIRDRVEQLKFIVRREPGAEEAVNKIEEYMETEGCF